MSEPHILVIIVPYVLKETSPQYPRAKIRVEVALSSAECALHRRDLMNRKKPDARRDSSVGH